MPLKYSRDTKPKNNNAVFTRVTENFFVRFYPCEEVRTSSSVSRTLTTFEKEGLIEVQGRRIKILDKKRLEKISSIK